MTLFDVYTVGIMTVVTLHITIIDVIIIHLLLHRLPLPDLVILPVLDAMDCVGTAALCSNLKI